MDPAYPRRGGARRAAVAVGEGQDVRRGGGEPVARVVAPVAVLVDAGHGEGVQRLQQQRAQPGDRAGQVRVQPPRHAARPEEAVVGRLDGNAGGERRRGALEQRRSRENVGRHGDDQPGADEANPCAAVPMPTTLHRRAPRLTCRACRAASRRGAANRAAVSPWPAARPSGW